MAPAFLALIRGNTGRRAALAAILALAAALRLHRLPEQGLLLFDEGFLVREARSISTISGNLAALAGGNNLKRPVARQALADSVNKSPVLFAKPVHNFLLASVLALEPRAELATLGLSAVAGILTVLATYLLGQTLFGWSAGIIGALLLAVSPYHLLYSRSGLSDSLAILFWTASLWAWIRGGKYSSLVSGVAGGLCIASNYRELFIPLVFLILAFREAEGIRTGAASFAAWLGGFLAVMLAFELPYLIAESLSGSSFPNGTWIGQLGTLLSFHGSQGFLFSGWPAFFYHFASWEGAGSLAWLIVAAAFQFSRWGGKDGALNLALLLPWFIFSAYWDNASRFFSIIIPLVAIMKGRWIIEGWRFARNKSGGVPATILVLAVFLAVLPRVRPMVPRHTPYAVAAKTITESGIPFHFSTNPWIGDALLGPGASAPFPPDPRLLKREIPARYAVTDLQALFGGFYQPENRYRTAGWVAKRYKAILVLPYSPEALRQYIFEQDLDFQGATRLFKELENQSPSLKVFDLSRPIRR